MILSLAFLYQQMDILIHVKDGDSTLVRFEGCGCSSPALVSTNPSNCSGARTSEQRVQRRPFPGQVRAIIVFKDDILRTIYSAED